MKLLGKKLLQDFKQDHPDAQSQIESWELEVEDAQWETPHDLKSRYPKASLIGNQQVVFDDSAPLAAVRRAITATR